MLGGWGCPSEFLRFTIGGHRLPWMRGLCSQGLCTALVAVGRQRAGPLCGHNLLQVKGDGSYGYCKSDGVE